MKRRHIFSVVLAMLLALLLCGCGADSSSLAGSATVPAQPDPTVDVTEDEEDLLYDSDDLPAWYAGFYNEDEDDAELETEVVVEAEAEAPVLTYVLNTNTKKFHKPDCRSVKQMKETNKKVVEATRDEIIAQGYDPCGNCLP